MGDAASKVSAQAQVAAATRATSSTDHFERRLNCARETSGDFHISAVPAPETESEKEWREEDQGAEFGNRVGSGGWD